MMVLISVVRSISNRGASQDWPADCPGADGAGDGPEFDDAPTCVAATNPSTAAAPTAYQGYCCVHQRRLAACWAVSFISSTVRCMAALASAACCVRKTLSSVVSYCRVFCGTVGNAVSEGGALLELTLVILLHLLQMPPALPGAHPKNHP